MVTPIKLLLSPKLLSPLSPVTNKISGLLNVTSPQKSLDATAKKLLFISTSNQIKQESYIKSNVKIQITTVDDNRPKFEKKELFEINTPNAKDILEKGINEFNFDILGRGAFGTVVKSAYKGKTVAVKVVKLRENAGKLNELLALSLDHPNIIKTKEIIDNVPKKYGIIIMEYLENFTHLQHVINENDGDIGDETIRKYCKDICSALLYCHKNKLVHLDVKPKNILVSREMDFCKLCDFGNSYLLENGENTYKFRGTVSYAAPELLLGGKPTSKCDIYSFGVLLWQLVHRENPYKEIKQYELIVYQVVKFNLRPKCFVKNQRFDSLYKKCWSQKSEDRPNAVEILDYLGLFV